MASPKIVQELKDMITEGRGRLPLASMSGQERRGKLRLKLGLERLFQKGLEKRHLERTQQIEEELDQQDHNASEGQQVKACSGGQKREREMIHWELFEYDDVDSFLDVPTLCSSSLPPSCVPCPPSSSDDSDNLETSACVRLFLLQPFFRIQHGRVLELPSTFWR